MIKALVREIYSTALTKHGERQTIETLISEEALLLARFLRAELKTWVPRIW